MSADRALHLIDTLLDVLKEAEKRASSQETVQEEKTSLNNINTQPISGSNKYFKSYSDVKEGSLIRVTTDVNLLKKEWNNADMGSIDDLKPYCGCVGKVLEVEDDDTMQVEWGNFDPFWLPVLACEVVPDGTERSIPGTSNSWLNEKVEEEKVNYFTSVEDGVKVNNTAKVTNDLEWLKKCWDEAELGPSDHIKSFLGCIGSIREIEEDDDTIKLRWENFDEVWIPVKACTDAKGVKPTLPSTTVSWLN